MMQKVQKLPRKVSPIVSPFLLMAGLMARSMARSLAGSVIAFVAAVTVLTAWSRPLLAQPEFDPFESSIAAMLRCELLDYSPHNPQPTSSNRN